MLIRGGNQLGGEVAVSGSKNAVLALLAASLLSSGASVRLSNVPLQLTDVRNMVSLLASLGVAHRADAEAGTLDLDCSRLTSVTPRPCYVRALRASFLVTGPLLARAGEARVALPGGCKIGSRPVDLHLKGLAALGADIAFGGDAVHVTAPKQGLRGAEVRLDYPSVGATETVLMAACFAEGETVIANAAREPEVEELGKFIAKLHPGVAIDGLGTSKIVIRGVGASDFSSSSSSAASPAMAPGGVAHHVIPDRIEAGTFLACGAITGSEGLTLSGVHYPHVAGIADVLREMGAEVSLSGDGGSLTICADHRGGHGGRGGGGEGLLRAVPLVETSPYPGFPTDMQPLMCSLLSASRGASEVRETVFESRMSACVELAKMGAAIDIRGQSAFISGCGPEGEGALRGASVRASDLRAGVALVVAGLAARGETVVRDMSHIDRGYVNLESKLRCLGADIERISLDTTAPGANQ